MVILLVKNHLYNGDLQILVCARKKLSGLIFRVLALPLEVLILQVWVGPGAS